MFPCDATCVCSCGGLSVLVLALVGEIGLELGSGRGDGGEYGVGGCVTSVVEKDLSGG